ncbi:MAG TPA: hypothetical protein VGH33_23345 [Isosphaeraceae bacterium]|jgi:hypothetical protein
MGNSRVAARGVVGPAKAWPRSDAILIEASAAWRRWLVGLCEVLRAEADSDAEVDPGVAIDVALHELAAELGVVGPPPRVGPAARPRRLGGPRSSRGSWRGRRRAAPRT